MLHPSGLILRSLFAVLTVVVSCERLSGDDPLGAMPTATESVGVKVSRLTVAQRNAIKLPKDHTQLVLSIAATDAKDEEPHPWFKAYADGKIECAQMFVKSEELAKDKLTQDELLWLLHLAVNECRALERTTADLQASYDANSSQPSKFGSPPSVAFHYHLKLDGKGSDFTLPSHALILRPLRSKMALGEFASWHRYTSYLVSRAFFGDATERVVLLTELNKKLAIDQPSGPPFQIVHLTAATRNEKFDLLASFEQEIALGNAKYRKLMGTVTRSKTESKPTFSINTMEFSKFREKNRVPNAKGPRSDE